MSNKQASNKPAHHIRSGAIEVAIWRNESEKAGTWYNVTMSRSYKQEEAWEQSDNFGYDDLLVLAKLLDMAHTWIMSQPKQSKQQAA